jgi:hypothetical protein
LDVWENGEPNRPFRIIGIVEDETLENRGAAPGTLNVLNVASAAALAGREKRMVLEAKKHGADAIVYLAANRNFLGAGQYETNFKQQTKIAAIKYADLTGLSSFPLLQCPKTEIEKAFGAGRVLSMFVAIYREGKTDAFALATTSPFTNEQISGLLKFCAESNQWQSAEPLAPNTKHWLRSDGSYYALAATDRGYFIIANQKTLPPKKL